MTSRVGLSGVARNLEVANEEVFAVSVLECHEEALIDGRLSGDCRSSGRGVGHLECGGRCGGGDDGLARLEGELWSWDELASQNTQSF